MAAARSSVERGCKGARRGSRGGSLPGPHKKSAPRGAPTYKKNAPRGAPTCSFRKSSTSSCCSLLASRACLKEWITMLVHITQVSRLLSRGIAPMLLHHVRELDADASSFDDETTGCHRRDNVL